MINRIKLCCFSVNSVHACIIANNFIANNIRNAKVINISQGLSIKKIKKIVDKYYLDNKNNVIYVDIDSEKSVNNYSYEKFVFVIFGDENFISNTNKYLDNVNFKGYIINCYDIFQMESKDSEVIRNHDYYINTTGIYKKESIVNVELKNIKKINIGKVSENTIREHKKD